MQPPAHTASTTAVAASSDASPPAAAAAAEASAAETADLLSTHAAAPAAANGAAPSPAAAPAAAGPQQASADSSNHSSPPAAASPSAVVDASTQSTDDEDSEYSKQLQDEIQQASCCQDILDIVADEASHFQSYHTVAALARLAKLGRGLAREQRFEVLADPGFIALLGRLSQQAVAGVLTPFELSNAFYSCGVLQVSRRLVVLCYVCGRRGENERRESGMLGHLGDSGGLPDQPVWQHTRPCVCSVVFPKKTNMHVLTNTLLLHVLLPYVRSAPTQHTLLSCCTPTFATPTVATGDAQDPHSRWLSGTPRPRHARVSNNVANSAV